MHYRLVRETLPKRKNNSETAHIAGATVGYEAQLWQMADALRGSMDAAEYKHVVLGLIFLKYISDAFKEQHARLAKINLTIRGIDGQIAHGDTFNNDRHPDLKADFILANPPFNVSDWRGNLGAQASSPAYLDIPGFCKSATPTSPGCSVTFTVSRPAVLSQPVAKPLSTDHV